jgi:hypothetical protein
MRTWPALVSLPGEPDPVRVKAVLHRWYLDRARTVFSDVLDGSLRHFKVPSARA